MIKRWMRTFLAALTSLSALPANAFLVILASAVSSPADGVTFGTGTNTFSMEFSLVRSVGNLAQNATNRDHSFSGGDGLGAVGYAYKIGTYEVTVDQFAKARAASGNTIGDGDENYWQASRGVDAPAVYVSFYEAAKFCNWLTSGSATNGAYIFNSSGNFTGIDRTAAIAIYRKVYVLPSRDEWVKAAYYDTENGKYTLYAFGINTAPVAGTDANYINAVGAGWPVGTGNIEQNGTYDMMGNVWEWCEQPYLSYQRILGGNYQLATNYMYSAGSSYLAPGDEKFQTGFRAVELYTPPHAQWSDYLYSADYLDGTSHFPTNYLKIFVATNGYNCSTNINNPNTPIQTLYYARYLINAIETYDAEHGLNRFPGYAILLKRGHTFVPYDYFTLTNNPPVEYQCINEEYNRAAFYWNINKPLFITSYGSSGDRPVIYGQTNYIAKANSHGTTNLTVRVQFPFMICAPASGWNNQNTVIENLHIDHWELSGVWNYRNQNCEIRNNIIERIGTIYFPGEEYIISEGGQKVGGGPVCTNWPIYAGGAIYAQRSRNVNIHNNVIKNVHNLDKDNYPLVDKLHTLYVISASITKFQSNLVQRVSGPPLTIRASSNVVMTCNTLENAAAVTNVTQWYEWTIPYVQQGFVRMPATYDISNHVDYANSSKYVQITDNQFFYPYFWDIEFGRSTNCTGQAAVERSGEYFESLYDGHRVEFLMTNNTVILDWDPNW